MSGSGKITYAVWLGAMEYSQALNLQLRICACKKRGFEADLLLLLEHPPTITLGRNGQWHNLLVSAETLQAKGVARFETDRGGDITFHGPGQLVGYPILKLETPERDVHRYMRNLEESLIRFLAGYGITGRRKEQLTGVWTEQGKIAAMGVHISRWITRHGFALNVNTELAYYDLIVPCGIAGQGVTSMGSLLSRTLDMREAVDRYAIEFGCVFNRKVVPLSAALLQDKLQRHAQEVAVA